MAAVAVMVNAATAAVGRKYLDLQNTAGAVVL